MTYSIHVLCSPWLHQINVRQFKITTILEWFSASVPCFMTFIFKKFCIISGKIEPAFIIIIITIKILDIGFVAIAGWISGYYQFWQKWWDVFFFTRFMED